MVKNLFLLVVFTWVSFSYAAHPVQQESISNAENFKVEKPVEEQDAQRSVAGAKIKKKNKQQSGDGAKGQAKDETDSEVRYWEYSE